MELRVRGVPELLAHWPNTVAGKLAAENDVAEAVDAAVSFTAHQSRRLDDIIRAAIELNIPVLPATVLVEHLSMPNPWRVFARPLQELRGIDLCVYIDEEAPESPRGLVMPRGIVAVSCRPRYEGRWTQLFDREAQLLDKAAWLTTIADAKVGGNPAWAYRLAVTEGTAGLRRQLGTATEQYGIWMTHLPGTFVYGNCGIEGAEKYVPDNAGGPAAVSLTLDVPAYLEMVGDLVGNALGNEVQLLGLDTVRQFDWRGRFVGELVLDEIALETDGTISGIVGALLGIAGQLPKQALPKGAMAQLRTTVDFGRLFDLTRAAAGPEFEMTAEQQQDLVAGLTGGIAIGLNAPSPGALLPRIFVSLGIADEERLRRVLAAAMATMSTKEVTYDGVACTRITFDDGPQGLRPTFCIVDGQLHVAESGRSLRALLAAQDGQVEAMDVGDAPIADGPGELLPTFDLRLDEAALYSAFRDTWLPIYEAMMPSAEPRGAGASAYEPALERRDMPPVDLIADYCRPSRATMRRHGNRFTIRHLGALGGAEVVVFLMTFGPMISRDMNAERNQTVKLRREITRRKLAAVWQALEIFQDNRDRWPNDLAELFATASLADNALLLPGDDLAETVDLGNGRTIRSSFRYYPDPVIVHEDPTLLIEIRAKRTNRAVLTDSGRVQLLGGDASRAPIDQFGN